MKTAQEWWQFEDRFCLKMCRRYCCSCQNI